MLRVFACASALLLAACTRSPPRAQPRPLDAGAKPPTPITAPLTRGFWAKDGSLVVATKTDLYKADLACAATSRVAKPIDDVYAANGQDVFVVRSGDTYERWDAAKLERLGPLEHHAPDAGSFPAETAALSPNHIAIGHELFDPSTGARQATFDAKWIEHLSFSDNGKYLLARAQSTGLWIVDAATGKTIVARPKWSAIQEVHGWNRPDLAQILGDELVVTGGDAVEHIDLTTGKTLGQLVDRERTASAFAPRSRRVSVFDGTRSRLRVWDVASHAVVATFELGKAIESGADCTHCAVEFDELDEDKLWLTSAYTNDRLWMRVSTGAVERVEAHELPTPTTPSKAHRVEPTYARTGGHTCSLVRRAADAGATQIPKEFCDAPIGYGENYVWPYPGFDASGQHLATVVDGRLSVWDVERNRALCQTTTSTPPAAAPR